MAHPGSGSRIPAPFAGYRDTVRPEWIDHNGHMNVGYYAVVFDLATDAWLEHLGLGLAYKERAGVTTFALEAHSTYRREATAGEALRFTTQLLDFDAKRIHYFHRMLRGDDAEPCATNELLSLHVSRATRRGAPMERAVLERLAAVREAHARLATPPEVGRVMGLRAAPTTGDAGAG